MNDGDWICGDPNCGNINFARRVSCYRCNKERPDGGKAFKKKLGTEIGKSAAEKSRGLFNADDWQCNKCANVNWARRHTCNVCNAPKFGEVEARTGYGGGYNERGVVEYRRREPSSDDEYDEFGRKKRKRKHEHQDKVGITEGAAFKKLPATMLQKEKLEHVIPGPAPKIMHANNERDKMTGSLSDGSVCELPPLSKMAFRRNQLQTQTNYHRQDHMLPGYKSNGFQSHNFPQRKRYSSTGDRDQTGSSGYDTASKKSKRDSSDSPVKAYDPVMENRVSSTNNDFVYKFTGSTPTEDFQVTYTLEERVRAAAFALVYSNCKITTEKFEWLFDKPAPDFKTIFGWRQRLLTTGCLVDKHNDKKNSDNVKKNTVIRIPNPEEIPILSDSDDDESNKDAKSQSKISSRQRSVSAETLLIPANEQDTRGGPSSISTGGRRSHVRSQSESSQSHSSSRDSEDSNYPDTDSEKQGKSSNSKTSATNNKSSIPSKISVHDSDSDSISYNSEDENFLSRVYGEGRKVKRKFKKRPAVIPGPAAKPSNIVTNDNHNFQGYSTAKPSAEQTPLVTGNIYTSNLRNMNVRQHENVQDIDGCSSEYIPSKLGSTTKNYQEFKNNVRRKGYWAKGNGTTFGKTVTISNEPITRHIPNIYSKPPQNTANSHFYSVANPQAINKIGNQKLHNTATMHKIQTVSNVAFQNIASFPKFPNTENLQNVLNLNETINKPLNKPQENFNLKNQMLPLLNEPVDKSTKEIYPSPKQSFSTPVQSGAVNRSKIDFSSEKVNVDEHLPFKKIAQSTPKAALEKAPENSSRIFDVVQSNNTSKNRSILDIFMNDDQIQKSPETNNDLDKYDGVHKRFETAWDEDDDALYKNDNMDECPEKQHLSTLSTRSQSPISNMLYATDEDQSVTPKKVSPELIQSKQDMLLGLLKDFQSVNHKEYVEDAVNNLHQQSSDPQDIPVELSNEIISMSEEHISADSQEKMSEPIKSSKQIQVLESITIKPALDEIMLPESNDGSDTSQQTSKFEKTPDQSKVNDLSERIQNTEIEIAAPPPQPTPVIDLTNLLSGINTNTLLLALQNLQQMNQGASNDKSSENGHDDNAVNKDNDVEHVETINLTNDEEWEKESNRDGSIERELQKLDGNTGDTPFLSDIFDPGPVVLPSNIGRKLNINLKSVEEDKAEVHKSHLNDNAPVIGNFKSFALPKPIMLNRLKLTVKPAEKPKKPSNGKKIKRKKKSKASGSQGEEEEEDEEESGDEADLSKYDLWGSDEEQGNSSKAENIEKPKEGESSKEGQEKGDKNGKSASPPPKKSSKRSRSSSTSSSSSSSSSSSHSSTQAPKNKFDDFNLNSERESSPKGRKSRSRSPRAKPAAAPARRKSRDSRSAGETRSHDKEWSRERERRERARGRDERKERRYSRDGHYAPLRGRHR